MRKFLISFTVFALPIILLSWSLDYLISAMLKHSTTHALGETAVWEDIYGAQINADIAVYGSSRAWVHIDPLILEDTLHLSAYNLGMDGSDFYLQYYRHLEYLKYNPAPKYILLSLDVFTLTGKEEIFNYTQFLPYTLYNAYQFKNLSFKKGLDAADYLIPLYRYYGEKMSILQACNTLITANKPFRNKGFHGRAKEWSEDLINAKDSMEEYVVDVDSNTLALFEYFITSCKRNSIELIFVYTPEYIEGQQFVTNRGEVIKFFTHSAEKHGIMYLDYSVHPMSYEKKWFYNSLHLNREGANMFTSILAHDLNEKLRINQ